jgi:hypothetical protein
MVSGYRHLADDDDDRVAGGNTHACVQAYIRGSGWSTSIRRAAWSESESRARRARTQAGRADSAARYVDRGRGGSSAIPASTYHDSFGNFCHVVRAHAGRLTVSADFLIRDSGAPDRVAREVVQHSLETLPVEHLVYLLGSRYCETDRFIEGESASATS